MNACSGCIKNKTCPRANESDGSEVCEEREEKMDKGKTIGEMMKECLAVKTQEEADVWFKEEVQIMKDVTPAWSLEECAKVVRSNIGYCAGYYDRAASEHVAKFFNANHPIFGGPGYWGKVSTQKEV